jgi:signal transduction histidine kinase
MLGTLQMLWSANHPFVQAGTLARGGGAQADLLVMARALADRAAVAIDNARLHSELQAAMRAREAFFAAVSHDLKNPLTTIGLWTEQLQLLYTPRDETEGRRVFEQALDRIHAAVGRSIGLIEEVLDVARLSTGEPLHLQRASVDLVHLTREVVHEQAVLEARAVRLEARARALRGRWDPARLRRVLDNLLSNAHKYSPHGREVVIRLTRDDTSPAPAALLTVQDEGIGIPATDLPHIFERFYRATNVHDFIQGSGLGLWGARHIVEQHGGTLTLQSQEGVGTTVAVRLPLSRAARKRSPAGTASRR